MAARERERERVGEREIEREEKRDLFSPLVTASAYSGLGVVCTCS